KNVTITNGDTGRISGAIVLAQSVFNIQGGNINGKTTGEDQSIVNFDLAAVTQGTVNPFDQDKPNFGFMTSECCSNGDIILALGKTSAINVNSGALLLRNSSFQAESITVDSDVYAQILDADITVGAGGFVNNGFLVVSTSPSSIAGTLDNK